MQLTHDPFRHCESRCNHELAPGILVSDLLEEDGPHPPLLAVVRFGLGRGWLPDVVERALPAAG